MLTEFFQRPFVISAMSGLAGFVLASLVNLLRSRIKDLEYTATHLKIALSAEDQIFGAVRVTWQNTEVRNLYLSTIELTNSTTSDLQDFTFKIFTGDETLLLSEKTGIPGSSYIVHWDPAFAAKLAVVEGDTPTPAQFETYRHTREYLVPTLNRSQSVKIEVLTTVPNGELGPSVWADCLHSGVRVRHVQVENSTLGVPTRFAQPLGLLAAIAVTVAATYSISSVGVIATISCAVGMIAILLGALIVRLYRAMRRVLVR